MFVIFLFLASFVYAKGPVGSGMLSSPEAKASVLKNSIDALNNVNLATGEYQVRYSFPSFQSRGGASFTPTLVYNPSFTTSRSLMYQHFSDAQGTGNIPLDITDVPFKDPFSWTGNGWSLNPFGYIALEKVIREGEPEDQHSLVLPDGTSSRLVLVKKEYSSVNDPSVPEWNGPNIYITEYLLEDNPYFLIKRYRTYDFNVLGASQGNIFWTLDNSLGRANIYKDYKWFVQAPDNSKYYFEHANINKKVFVSTYANIAPYGPYYTQTHYYPFYNKWDIIKWVPNGNEENAVSFSYSDFNENMDLGFDYYARSYVKCKEVLGSCTPSFSNGEIGRDLWNQKYEYFGDTSYLAASYPRKISGQDTEINFDLTELDDIVVYETDFNPDTANEWNFYCSNRIDCNPSKQANIMKDQFGGTFLSLQGNKNSKWGAYALIANLEPFTSYVIKAQIEVPMGSVRPRLDSCTAEDMLKTPYYQAYIDGNFRKGFFALVKLDARSVKNNDFSKFSPDVTFNQDRQAGGMFPLRTSYSNMPSTSDNIAMYHHDSYNINCWNYHAGGNLPKGFEEFMNVIRFETENTFSTADEISKVLVISGYKAVDYVNPRIVSLKIEKVPKTYYLDKITYKKGGKPASYGWPFMIFNLDYKKESGLEYYNIDKIQQLSLLPVPENKIPATSFEYNGRILKKINLPTEGNIEFDITTTNKEYKRPNAWGYVYNLFDEPIKNQDHLKKSFTKVDKVKVYDGSQTLVLDYSYNNPYWDDEKETFFAGKTTVTNNADGVNIGDMSIVDGGKTEYVFYTSPKELKGSLKKTTRYIKPSLLFLSKAVSSDENDLNVFKGYDIQQQPCTAEELKIKKDMCDDLAINSAKNPIYHVRNLKTTVINYDENGENPKTTETEYMDFDTANCDMPTKTMLEGFTDDPNDDRYSITTYTTIDNGNNKVKCLPNQVSLYNKENIEKSRTSTSYHEDSSKIGLAKQATNHNLEDQSKNIVTTSGYDQYRNPVSIKNTLNKETTIAYDAQHHKYPVSSTNPLGQSVSLEYDVFGRAISFTDMNGNKKYFLYDDVNRLCKVQDILGEEPQFKSYDAIGICGTFDYGQATAKVQEPEPGCPQGQIKCNGICMTIDECTAIGALPIAVVSPVVITTAQITTTTQPPGGNPNPFE